MTDKELKTYDEHEVPMEDRRFMTFHGSSFVNFKDEAMTNVAKYEAFTIDEGEFSPSELFAISNLFIAQAWLATDYSDFTIVRIK